MTKRSQRRKEEIYGYRPPAITGIAPDTATLTAAGAAGRLIATLSATGGTAPFTWTAVVNGGLSYQITGNAMVTTADPCGTVGARIPQVMATDSKGKTLTETITVNLT